MSNENRADGEYSGTEFYITKYWKFIVPALDREFADYESMTTAIDSKIKDIESSRREKMSIACLTMNGAKVTLTGIHAGHGGFLTSPKLEKFSNDRAIYPDCQLVRDAIKRRDDITASLNMIDDALKSLAVEKFDPGYGHNRKLLVHQDEVNRVKMSLADIAKQCESIESVDDLVKRAQPTRDTKRRIRV